MNHTYEAVGSDCNGMDGLQWHIFAYTLNWPSLLPGKGPQDP